MSKPFVKPAFVTFTGVDSSSLIPGMRALSATYPIEWGVLLDPERQGSPRFPGVEDQAGIRCSGLRLSAHICGDAALRIVDGMDPDMDLGGYARAQVNHGRSGSDPAQVANGRRFGARRGVRVALQCQGPFPSEWGIDWLYDVSFGTGVRPSSWPALTSDLPFGGYSGGLGPDNVREILAGIPVSPDVPYWIDMESAIRTDDRFDLSKCRAVCEAIF